MQKKKYQTAPPVSPLHPWAWLTRPRARPPYWLCWTSRGTLVVFLLLFLTHSGCSFRVGGKPFKLQGPLQKWWSRS